MGRRMEGRAHSKRAETLWKVLDRLVHLDEGHQEEWPQRLQDLFVTRNEAVHPDAGPREPLPGQSGTMVAPVHRLFSAEAAGHALRTMTEIISTVVETDRSRDEVFGMWADQHRDVVRRTITGLADTATVAVDPAGRV